jgi:hypothetical protein
LLLLGYLVLEHAFNASFFTVLLVKKNEIKIVMEWSLPVALSLFGFAIVSILGLGQAPNVSNGFGFIERFRQLALSGLFPFNLI